MTSDNITELFMFSFDYTVLEKDGFSTDRLFGCLVAEVTVAVKSYLVGCALHFNSYCILDAKCMYMHTLYVKEELRAQGIGQLLLQAVVKVTIWSVFYDLLVLVALVCVKINKKL